MSSEKVPVQVSAREGYKVKKSRTGKAKDLDPHMLDAIMDTPAIASDFGNMFCSIGGLLLSTVARYNELTAK